MTNDTIILRQEFRSNLHFIDDFFKSDLVNDVQSGDGLGSLVLEKSIPQTYPLVIDLSNEIFTEDKISFETHLISFLFYHCIDKKANIRIYYAIGHRCDYDKANSCIGLSTPNNINLYAVLVENNEIMTITCRQVAKNKTHFEKNAPLFMCSYSYLPPSPLLLDDSGYLDSLYSNLVKEQKKYCQAFYAVLESLNANAMEQLDTTLDVETTHVFFLNFLFNHEKVADYHDGIQALMLSFTESKSKVVGNVLSYVAKSGIRKGIPASAHPKDFILKKLDELLSRAVKPHEIHAVNALQEHFSRNFNFDAGPLKLNQIISKPVAKPIKAPINEYDIKDFATRPFSPTRIQPIGTLFTDKTYEIASNYQGAKEPLEITNWSSTAYPMLIVEPVAKQEHKNEFHLHFVAFTVKESYTKAINANTMYRYLGYGYPFYFDGEKFALKDDLKIYGVILKKGVFTNFSSLDYLEFYENNAIQSVSLIGKRPNHAIETKVQSAHETLAIAVKNRETTKDNCAERLCEINASYSRFLKKNKKHPNVKTALEYISNMMLRTAKEEYELPKFALEINAENPIAIEESLETSPSADNQAVADNQLEISPLAQPIEQVEPINEAVAQNETPIQDVQGNSETAVSESLTDAISEGETKPELLIESTVEDCVATDLDAIADQTVSESSVIVSESPKTIFVQQSIADLDLPPIVEQPISAQEDFKVEFIHTPDCNKTSISDEEVKSILEVAKPLHPIKPENYAFNVDRSEVIREASEINVDADSTTNEDVIFSMYSNLGVEAEVWSEITTPKYQYEGVDFAMDAYNIYILEPNTDDAIIFNLKQILNKSDDYYLLKRAVGKSLAKDLRKFIKLKKDQLFLDQFVSI